MSLLGHILLSQMLLASLILSANASTTNSTTTETSTDTSTSDGTTSSITSTELSSTASTTESTTQTTESPTSTIGATSTVEATTSTTTESTTQNIETTTTESPDTTTQTTTDGLTTSTSFSTTSEYQTTSQQVTTVTGTTSEASTVTETSSDSSTIESTANGDTTTDSTGLYGSSGDRSVVVMLGTLLALFMLLFVLLFLYVINRRSSVNRAKRAEDHAYDNTEMDMSSDGIERIRETDIRVMTDPLGEGRFGDILPGQVQRGTRKVDVAFKTLKSGSSDLERSGFMAQLSLYNKLDPHPHIIQFFGLCSVGDQLFAAFEMASNGNLRNFLRRNGVHEGEPEAESPVISLNRTMLLNFAYESSLGLQYLESKKIVHREVMSRHVLLTADCTCKLAGLNEAQRSDKNIHVRWMSPECLQNGIFNSKSDAWAFGILLYEIMTLGGQPYPDIASKELPVLLQQEYIMPMPENCEPMIYDIMKLCWDFEPELRPDFSVLSSKIKIAMETAEGTSEMAIDIDGLEDDWSD